MAITEEDIKFLDEFFNEELTDERMMELDTKLEDEDFKNYYQERLDKKFDRPLGKNIVDSLPLIIFVALVVIGIYLFIKSN